jgi:DNA-directed RNA polymerase subunit RPC12/RpoP
MIRNLVDSGWLKCAECGSEELVVQIAPLQVTDVVICTECKASIIPEEADESAGELQR